MSRRGMRDWAFCALASVKGLLKRACLSVSLSVCAVKLLYIENELIQRWMIDSRTNTVSRATKFHSRPSVTTQAYYDQKIEGHSMSLCNNLLSSGSQRPQRSFPPANKVWVCPSMTPKVPLLSGEGDSGPQYMVPWAQRPRPKRHLDPFSRFENLYFTGIRYDTIRYEMLF